MACHDKTPSRLGKAPVQTWPYGMVEGSGSCFSKGHSSSSYTRKVVRATIIPTQHFSIHLMYERPKNESRTSQTANIPANASKTSQMQSLIGFTVMVQMEMFQTRSSNCHQDLANAKSTRFHGQWYKWKCSEAGIAKNQQTYLQPQASACGHRIHGACNNWVFHIL